MGRETEVEIRNLAGGLNTQPLFSAALSDNESPNCSDVRFDRGSVEKRSGFKRVVNDALRDPGLHLNKWHGHIRIPAHADFDYGTNWEIVIKFRMDSTPPSSERYSLYCHGYAGGTSISAGLLRSMWIYVDDSSLVNASFTYADGSNTVQHIQNVTAISNNVNYSLHVRRFDDGGTDRLQIEIWNLDTQTQHSISNHVASVADGQIDLSSLPINLGAAPVLDTSLSIRPTLIDQGVDHTGGIFWVNGPDTRSGAVQETLDGTLGGVQVWIGMGAARAASSSDDARLDTLDSDVVGGFLKGYWRINEGSGTDVQCATEYGINQAASKDGKITGFGPTWVAGLVGSEKTRHALRLDGEQNVLIVYDRSYVTSNPGTVNRTGLGSFGWLEAMTVLDLTPSMNPWTFEFVFQFHKNANEYNVTRKQCICAWRYRYSHAVLGTMDFPLHLLYVDESQNLKVDILTALNFGTGVGTYTSVNLGAVAKDTTYHFMMQRYNSGADFVFYLNGLESGNIAGVTPINFDNSDISSPLVSIYFGAAYDRLVEWNSTNPGTGFGGYRTECSMPSNMTLDEVRLWAWEDPTATPVGVRTKSSFTAATPVPSAENPPTEDLVVKYKRDSVREVEITGKQGLWIYYPFHDEQVDYFEQAPNVMWTIDESRYRMFPGVLLPASNVPSWGRGVIPSSTVDSDYANNSLVHNQVGAVDGIFNKVNTDDTQTLLHVQSSTLRSLASSGSSYVNETDGFKSGSLLSAVQAEDNVYLANSPKRVSRWDGTNLRVMGIPAPAVPPITGYFGLRSAPEGHLKDSKYYTYRITYVNIAKNLESDPSPESPALFTSPTGAGLGSLDDKEFKLSLPQPSDPQSTKIRIYRSEPLSQKSGDLAEYSSATGSQFRLVGEVHSGSSSLPNNATNFTAPQTITWHEGAPDSDLGPFMEVRHAPPPPDPAYIVYWRGRTWCARTSEFPARLYFSEAGLPDYYHAENFFNLDEGDGEPITAVVPLLNRLLVFKSNSIYAVSEDSGVSPSTLFFPFSLIKMHSNVGAASHHAAVKLDESTVLFLSQKGIYATDGQDVRTVSQKVENIFRDEVRRNVLADAVATIHKKRNDYLLCVSTNGVDNDLCLVLNYPTGVFTRYNLNARSIIQTEDTSGIERIFFGGVTGQGYVNRFDSGNADGIGILLPSSATEAASLTGTATGGTTTTIQDTAADWNGVNGDGLVGVKLKLTKAGVTTTHTVVATSTSGTPTLTFQPPFGSAVDTSVTYILGGIDGIWRSKQFDFGTLSDQKVLQDLEVIQEIQSTTGTASLEVALATENGTFQVNSTGVDLTTTGSYKTVVPFKGIGWVSGGGTSRGRLLQIRLRNRNPNQPFQIHALVARLELSER